jgi:PHD/YefM family antitoxin component YafN of YafNO toxin-antitoxin module
MEYDSRPRTKLFSLADKNEETKELFFIGRKAMAILGSIAGVLIAVIIYLFSDNILIPLGIGAAVGLSIGFFPILMDKRKETYFLPLINKMIELLQEFEIDTDKQKIMDLLSFKEIRISNEHVLVAVTKEGKLSVYVASDYKPEKVKTKKPSSFPIEVLEKEESDVKAKTVVSGEEPQDAVILSEEHFEEEISEIMEGIVEEEMIPGTALSISAFVTSGNSHTATSTDAIDIVSVVPQVYYPAVPTIGEIAPGVTGPIPITVGDRSLTHAEDTIVTNRQLAAHVDSDAVPSTVASEVPRGRHGRRSAG